MSSSLEKITVRRERLRAEILMRIHFELEQKSLIPKEGIHLVDPRAEQEDWLLSTVQLSRVGTSGKCHCKQYHGETITYDLEEFSTDSLFYLLTLLANGK